VHTSAGELVRYHEQHLSNGDYHLEEGKVRGEFIGALSDEWGLSNEPILKEDPRFRAFAKLDISRLSGRKLWRPRKSERPAIEFAYSAPKSVSIAAVRDPRVAVEMSAAIKDELKWFEGLTCCRDRRGELYNSEAARRTGKMLAAAFVHETSRAKDPSLHMHVLIANVTIDPERNEALAMSYGEMLEMRKTLDARIHNSLARRLSALGYTVEVAEHGFRLRDIPAPIEEIYSVRNREIATAKELLREGYTVQQLGDALRDRPVKEKTELWVSGKIRELLGTPKLPVNRSIDEHDLNEQAWLVTRRPKEITTTAELRANVQTRFRENGFEVFVAPEARSEPTVSMDLEKVINQGVEAVFERESIVRLDHLVGEIVRLAPGQADNSKIEAALKDKAEFVRRKVGDHEMITTRAIIAAIEALIERGGIRRGGITEAVEAILANRNAKRPVETIVLSSTHRVAKKVSDKLHEAHKATKPGLAMAQIAAFKVKALQPAELLSTASYRPGEIIEYRTDNQKPGRLAEVQEVVPEGVKIKGPLKGARELVCFDKVTAVYEKTILERGPGEVLLLTQKMKADGKVYENGSRQTIAAIQGDKMRFESGLELKLDDGRVRQGDAMTTYKAQGASKTQMIRVEDNRSLLAMANREDLPVAFTRHRAGARMFVQDVDVLRRVANRSLVKDLTARDLETRKIPMVVERIEEALRQTARLATKFATAAQRRAERIREMRLKKQRENARSQRREQNRAAEMAFSRNYF
jgi:conjugative relaxase-like TrwC/TraI family protein